MLGAETMAKREQLWRPLDIATTDYESRLSMWREWEWLSIEAGGRAK
jgi:hypothetical protein